MFHYSSLFSFFCVGLLFYCDQTNFGSNLLSFVTQYKIEPCLYQIVLLGDLTLGSHYEGSAQEIVTGLDILCGSFYTFQGKCLNTVIQCIQGSVSDSSGSRCHFCDHSTGAIQFVCIFAAVYQINQLFERASGTGTCLTTDHDDRLICTANFFPVGNCAIVKPAVELLAGIPSVIYGLLGIYLLNPLMYKLERLIFQGSTTHQFTGGANLLSAVIVLAIMILPTVINISETSIRAVPAGIKSSSLALGASHVQTIFRSILPAAKSGIVTAIVLGVGRAIGEAMAITLVSGSSVNVPLPFNSVRFLTTAIVSEMGYSSGLHRQVLFTIGLVLFVFIMIINIVLNKILKKGADDNE